MQNDNAAKFPFTVTANTCFARPEALAGTGSYQKNRRQRLFAHRCHRACRCYQRTPCLTRRDFFKQTIVISVWYETPGSIFCSSRGCPVSSRPQCSTQRCFTAPLMAAAVICLSEQNFTCSNNIFKKMMCFLGLFLGWDMIMRTTLSPLVWGKMKSERPYDLCHDFV